MKKIYKTNSNKVLARLAEEDQRDRQDYSGREWEVAKKDAERRKKVALFLKRKLVNTGEDFFNAALIYQHGDKIEDFRLAQKLAKKSIEEGNENGKWLYAATTDRLLINKGMVQKFGTQYYMSIEQDEKPGRIQRVMRLSPYDKKTTDEIRAQYNVPPLKKLLSMEKAAKNQSIKKSGDKK